MNFITNLPKAKGLDTILVVVDRLFLALAHPFTPKEAQKFVFEIVWLHGFPTSIISDRD